MEKQIFPRPPRRMRLGRAYVPVQEYRENYSPEVALRRGTFFPELYIPYQRQTGDSGWR